MVTQGFTLGPLQSLNFLSSVLYGFAEFQEISDTRAVLSWWWSAGEADSGVGVGVYVLHLCGLVGKAK